ncbi:hypothetical protein [Pararhodobacter oceanensis]|uniref:hypothetical protein n=1 Tax=Pararhodobacter oceanensis TaxID=2172121 RepID=UPI003A93A9CF
MTQILPASMAPHAPAKPSVTRASAPPSCRMRGTLALLILALLAGVAAQMPMRGDVLGLLAGVAGSLGVAGVITSPERRPLLAICWSALAFALPVTLTLADLGLAAGSVMTAAALVFWSLIAQPARG